MNDSRGKWTIRVIDIISRAKAEVGVMAVSNTNIDDFGITKEDVSYLSRGWALWAQMIFEVVIWTVAWWHVVEYRPGVIEAIIGAVFAIPVGFLYARSAIAQARAAAARSRQEAGPSLFPFCPDAGISEYILAVIGAFLACLLLVGFTYVVYLAVGNIGMPWAHFDVTGIVNGMQTPNDFPYQSVISASTAYFLTNIILVQYRMLSWYSKLPQSNRN